MLRRSAGWVALALLMLGAAARPVRADLQDNLGALAQDNAKKYLQPLPKAVSGTLNSAIFQTGHVPKNTINFSIGVKAMGVTFGSSSKTYTPTPPPGFSGTVTAPTVIGSTTAVSQSGPGGASIAYPGGFDVSNFSLAVPQLTVGSVFGTRAVVRWISVDLNNSGFGKLDYWGAGGQHSLSQYFHDLPVDVAAGFFIQKLKLGDDLLDMTAWHADVTASKRFMILEPYVGVGFDNFKMSVSYKSTTNPGDQIAVDFDPENNVHLTAGTNVMFAFVRLHGEVNVAAETGAAIGLSFGRF